MLASEVAMERYAAGLARGADGVWRAGAVRPVSYPEAAHAHLAEVEDSSFWFEHRSRCLLEVLRRLPPAGELFDVGGGRGAVALALRRAGLPAIVVEPSPDAAARARARGLAVVCSRFEDAGFLPGSLPAAGCFDVLEHLEVPEALLRGLHAALRPGARLYVTVPALAWLWSTDDEYAGHFRRYTERSLEALLEESGFALEYRTALFPYLPLPILLLRTLPSRLGLRAPPGAAEAVDAHRPLAPGWRALLEVLHAAERRRIRGGRRTRFGSSLLAVARCVG